jgi:hypothetical protein
MDAPPSCAASRVFVSDFGAELVEMVPTPNAVEVPRRDDSGFAVEQEPRLAALAENVNVGRRMVV